MYNNCAYPTIYNHVHLKLRAVERLLVQEPNQRIQHRRCRAATSKQPKVVSCAVRRDGHRMRSRWWKRESCSMREDGLLQLMDWRAEGWVESCIHHRRHEGWCRRTAEGRGILRLGTVLCGRSGTIPSHAAQTIGSILRLARHSCVVGLRPPERAHDALDVNLFRGIGRGDGERRSRIVAVRDKVSFYPSTYLICGRVSAHALGTSHTTHYLAAARPQPSA